MNRKQLKKGARRVERVTLRHAHKFLVQRWENIQSVRRHIIGWLILVGVLIGGIGLQMVWYQRSYHTEAAAAGGTYAEAVMGPVSTLNPLYVSSPAEAAAKRLVFSSLLTYDTTGHLKGDLADGYSVDQTGKIYTVKLRKDAHWQDSGLVTAQDVLFTINLIKDPTVRSPLRVNWSDVKVKIIDDQTLEFTLPSIYAAFPHALTFGVLPKHLLASVAPSLIRENAYSLAPIGSGPFVVRSIQTTNSASGTKVVHLAANKNYYDGAPKLDRFQLHVYPSHDAIATALKYGEVNAAADLTAADLSSIDQSHYQIDATPVDSGVYALFNTKSAVLSDKQVRRALQIGTNTAAIREKLVAATGDGASALAPKSLDLPFITNTDSTIALPQAPKYSQAEAKKILDQAGWVMQGNTRVKNGESLQLSVVTTKGGDYETVLQQLVGQWRDLGVTVNTQIVDPNDTTQNIVQTVLQHRNFDVLVYELAIGGDPDVYAYWNSSQISERGFNFSNYANQNADDLLLSARTRLEPELRAAKYASFARQWLEDAPAIGLYRSNSYYAHSLTSEAYDPSRPLVSPTDRYSNVIYWTTERENVYKTP